MIRIDVYRWGAGYRIRAHEHFSGKDDGCTEDCDDEAGTRCYPGRYDNPKETVAEIRHALKLALDQWGHVTFLNALDRRDRLM